MRVLVLSGTGDGRALVRELRSRGVEVVESVAGRTAAARALDGVRVGGFGGACGLRAWLGEHAVSAVIDATHPFAARMSRNAVLACAEAGVPLARWVRLSWRSRPDSNHWTWVADHKTAAKAAAEAYADPDATLAAPSSVVPSVGASSSCPAGLMGEGEAWGMDVPGARPAAPKAACARRDSDRPGRASQSEEHAVGVLLTVGRQELDAYRGVRDVLARVSEPPPGWTAPDGWELLVERGPFTLDGELVLLSERNIRVLVTKDSGGAATSAKLDAAAATGVRVVMIERPPAPAGVLELSNLADLTEWLGLP